jgi:phage recombination protein Bet
MSANAIIQAKRGPLLIEKMAEKYELAVDKFMAAIRGTVFKEGTNEQLAAFLVVANKYDLDPFTREIYAFASKNGGIVPVVPIDGWAKKVNENPQFDGFEFKDQFDDGREKIISITCRMFRKDRSHPAEITEYYSECYRDTEPWNKWPVRMLRWKAYIQCARVTFGLSGIYDPDEAVRIDPSLRKAIDAQEYAGERSEMDHSMDDEIKSHFERLKITQGGQATLWKDKDGDPQKLLNWLREQKSPPKTVSISEPGERESQSVTLTGTVESSAKEPETSPAAPQENLDAEPPESFTASPAPAQAEQTPPQEEPRQKHRAGRPSTAETARRKAAEEKQQQPVAEKSEREKAEDIIDKNFDF